MKKAVVVIFLIASLQAFTQERYTLTLTWCLQQATASYPLNRQFELYNQTTALKQSNLSKGLLPQLNLNGQLTYQSDVTKIPVSLPGMEIPEVKQDMYKLVLDVNQMIWDGGTVKALKRLESANNKVETANIEIELYNIRDKINQIYFNLLILQENEKLVKLAHEELENRMLSARSAVANGVMLPSSTDILQVEMIRQEEQLIEIRYAGNNLVRMLEEYLNTDIPDSFSLVLPDEVPVKPDMALSRKELAYFDLLADKVRLSESLVKIKTKPKVYGFFQYGYGRPGLNMLDSDFSDFYIAGIRFSWNIWNWHQNRNEFQLLDLQASIISNQKEIFEKNLRIGGYRFLEDIKKLELIIEKDREIVRLRKQILQSAASRFENGTLPASDFISEQNASLQADINLENHQLLLLKAKIDYLIWIGNY